MRLSRPSSLYGPALWNAGLKIVRHVPLSVARSGARAGTAIYSAMNRRRREVVFRNLLPIFGGDEGKARAAARRLFWNFGNKLADLLRYEAGLPVAPRMGELAGWDDFDEARRSGGVLLVTPHLGNWEMVRTAFGM